MKDLTKELHFSTKDATTIAEVKNLFEKMLALTWTIDIYRNKPAQTFNLKDLGWEINYNNAKTSAGKCKRKATRNRYTGEITVKSKTVELSNHLLRQNLEEGKASEWEETIRHELAHAVDIELRGKSNHDRTWKAVANAMLSTGRVTFSSDDLKDVKLSRYTLKCVEDDCNFTSPSHKKRKENAKTYPCCQTCYDNGKGYKRLLQVQNY